MNAKVIPFKSADARFEDELCQLQTVGDLTRDYRRAVARLQGVGPIDAEEFARAIDAIKRAWQALDACKLPLLVELRRRRAERAKRAEAREP